jgi:cytochrome b561
MTNGIDRNSYSPLSVALHWFAAIAVLALFFTHEGERGSAVRDFHVGGGAILGVVLLWRVLRRIRLGTAVKPAQAGPFNLLAYVVLWGMLASILLAVVSGYLLPWSLGRPLDIYGFAIPSPIPAVHWLHEVCEATHEISGTFVMPLFILHLAGVAKHVFFDADRFAVLRRMARPARDGV